MLLVVGALSVIRRAKQVDFPYFKRAGDLDKGKSPCKSINQEPFSVSPALRRPSIIFFI